MTEKEKQIIKETVKIYFQYNCTVEEALKKAKEAYK